MGIRFWTNPCFPATNLCQSGVFPVFSQTRWDYLQRSTGIYAQYYVTNLTLNSHACTLTLYLFSLLQGIAFFRATLDPPAHHPHHPHLRSCQRQDNASSWPPPSPTAIFASCTGLGLPPLKNIENMPTSK